MAPPNDNTPDNTGDSDKSKSQRKREATALQALGEELIKLNQDQLNQIDLPDNLLDAINIARKIHKRGGLKRQLQYIGKIMRNIDVEPISHALDAINQKDNQSRLQFHKLEQWRDRLTSDDKQALTDAFEAFPNADRQHLRQLVRKAAKELSENKPPAASRAIFQYLRELQQEL